MKRRGFVFTLDAILALLLVTMFVVSVSQLNNSAQAHSTYLRSQYQYVAEDTLIMLRTIPLKELIPPEKLEEWLSDGTLDTTLVTPDMSPIDIVSTYWATGPLFPEANLRHKAEIIMGYVLNNTIKEYNYELLINNYTSPYLRRAGANYSRAQDVTPATITLSGYAYNQTPRGYMARAYLTKAEYMREDIFGIQRVLASCRVYYWGWLSNNTLIVTSHFRLPDDAQVDWADLKLVERTDPQISDFYLNGQRIAGESAYIPNVPLLPGDNVLRAEFDGRNCPSDMGYGSGSMLYVKYQTNTTDMDLFDPARRYGELYDVQSYSGIYYLNALFVPGNITSISLHLVTEGVRDIRVYYAYGAYYYELVHKTVSPSGVVVTEVTAQEIENGLSQHGSTLSNLSQRYFNLVIALDSWWDSNSRQFRYDTTYRFRRLYGDGQSYIRINYIPTVLTTRYSIPLSIFKDYNDIYYSGSSTGNRYQRMSFTYDLPPNVEPWYVDVWTAIEFTTYTPTSYTRISDNGQLIYNYYSDIYMIRMAYSRLNESMMVPGQTNTFVAESTNVNEYGFRRGESRAMVNYLIEAYAGYGDIFPYSFRGYPNYKGYRLRYYGPNGERMILVGDPPYMDISVDELDPTKYAVDDAILRLFNNLNFKNDRNPGEWRSRPFDGSSTNPIDVTLPETVRIEFVSMGTLPELFEPITITLRVWRES